MASRPSPERLDLLLVKRGLAASRQRARALIEKGGVEVDGIVVDRPSRQVRPDQRIALTSDDHPWVGRGALKLLGALEATGINPQGRVCADLGASTGGFTEVLLHRGAQRVYAIDVGKGQLAWSLRNDDRVVVMEGVNARTLQTLPEPVDLLTADLSFISLRPILPTITRLLGDQGEALVLVKPQFEVGRASVRRGGRVKDEGARKAGIDAIRDAATAAGFHVAGSVDSGLAGAKAGNIEHFLHLVPSCTQGGGEREAGGTVPDMEDR